MILKRLTKIDAVVSIGIFSFHLKKLNSNVDLKSVDYPNELWT